MMKLFEIFSDNHSHDPIGKVISKNEKNAIAFFKRLSPQWAKSQLYARIATLEPLARSTTTK